MATGFNERIQRLIGVAGSQRKLAEIIGVSAPTITGWAGGSEPFESTFHRISERTGLSVAWLARGEGDEDAELATFRSRMVAKLDLMPGARGALRSARVHAGLSYADLGKKIGRRPDYLRSLEEGRAPISEQTAELIAAALPTINKYDLMEGSDAPRITGETTHGTYGAKSEIKLPPGVKGRYVPLLSAAQAGTWDADHSDAGYDYTGIFAMNVDDRRAFAIKVVGNSMEPKLFEGDMVICSPAAPLQNGQAAVVKTRSENVYIKYWQKRGERVILESANPDFEPIRLPAAEIHGAWPIVQTVSDRKIIKQL